MRLWNNNPYLSKSYFNKRLGDITYRRVFCCYKFMNFPLSFLPKNAAHIMSHFAARILPKTAAKKTSDIVADFTAVF